MNIPEEVFDKGLTPKEFYLFAILSKNSDRWHETNLTMEQLSELTGSSRTTLWRDLVSLEKHGLIETVRLKRNLGKLHKNKYKILCFSGETSTDNTLDTKITSITINTLVKNTTYSLGADAPEGEKMVNRWSEDDDNVGGFGLLEGEVPSAQKVGPVSKRYPKTRHLREQSEWTAADVASEFSARLYKVITGVPAIVNTDRLRSVIATYRKKYGTTALIELEVMQMFFGDDRVLSRARKEPHNAWRIFVRMITTSSQEALDKLDMTEDTAPDARRAESVFASDGTEFDNSMAGRLELEEYEGTLQK